MANTIATQTIVDGSKCLVVKIDILGDGSGEETDTVLIDASSFTPAFTNNRLCGIYGALNGFTARLFWDADTNVPMLTLPDYDFELTCEQSLKWGGIPNNAGTGKTGDILITTNGLGNGDSGTIIFSLRKKSA